MKKKPLIGIAGNILIMDGGKFPGMKRAYVNNDYVESIELCGGNAIIIPAKASHDELVSLLELLDGLVLSGGYDIAPDLYGEEPLPQQDFNYKEVDLFYIDLLKIARDLKKPVLGICKGMQAINVAFGGSLFQDLKVQKEGAFKHSQDALRYQASHKVDIIPETFLAKCFPSEIRVNSFHHQAVKEVAPDFQVAAVALDGVVEAIEYTGDHLMVGVQWHPEMMASFGNKQMQTFFQMFIEKCERK